MKSKQSRVRTWVASTLALAGLLLLIIWAVSLYSYGVWVDANGAIGEARPLDYVLFLAGVVLLVFALVAILIRRR